MNVVKITQIQAEGFGVWNDLSIEDLSPDMTVFYGRNEAGKTTLMQFIRGVLYGY
ncbi:MAG: AAA family ATPase, partial [Planctomycetota bacterium]|nr:AAA family ATPase [Planctomycetota bacterium]